MSGDAARDRGTLDSALLFLSRDADLLARLLVGFLAPSVLQELAKAAGHKRPGNQTPALQVARILADHPRLRKATVAALLEALPPAEQAFPLPEDEVDAATPERLRSALAHDLLQPAAEARERLATRLGTWPEGWMVLEDGARPDAAMAVAPNGKNDAPEAASGSRKEAGLKARVDTLKEQLRDSRRETARLEEELGRERKRRTELREQVAEAQADRLEAETRAASLKKKLAASTEASERERALSEEAEDARARQHLAERKLDLLAWERDDLRACLEDRDRFDAVREEEVPSFRNRPLLDKEQTLAAELKAKGGAFRILVVGGGEPQFRHRDKFLEYAEVMGFTGDWRMAEYVSWHKEMDKLSTDMNTRYDALVILHWNRTTFTRKAREVCNRAGQKPCITCYYEGFTSLRETLQECLRQLLARA